MARINVFETDELTGERTLAGHFYDDRAEQVEGRRQWDGNNMADVHVGANRGQNLYRTAQGRYVVETWSAWVNEETRYEFVTPERARDWLLINESDEIAEKWFGEVAEERGPGRPKIGEPVLVRFSAELRARIEARAREGEKFAETVRRLLTDALA